MVVARGWGKVEMRNYSSSVKQDEEAVEIYLLDNAVPVL